MNPSEPRVQLAIGSQYENIELVQVVVEDALRRLDLDEDASHSIGLAVREAVANAIKHGNRQVPNKRVVIDLGIEGDEIVIHVSDEGAGFEPTEVPDPTAPSNLLRANGRGILFMRSFMDKIDYRMRPSGGTVVTLRKHILGAAAPDPEEEA